MKRLKRSYEMDMCHGPLFSKIIMFAIPLILSGVLQLLFNAADIVVVGRFTGSHALAAVGSTSSLINLLVNLFIGVSVGANVLLGKFCGAQDYKNASETVHTAIYIAIWGGVIMIFAGLILARPLLELMGTPMDVIDLSVLYMRIYFIGMPAFMIYNFGAAILRAVGDTKRPLYFLTVAGVVNVLFNLLFVIVFKMGVAGVALATIISETISAGLIILSLMQSDGILRLHLKEMKFHKDKVAGMLKIGLPAGLQGMIFNISNVLIQSSVNSFGSVVMAGNTAASNIEGFVYTSMNAIYQTSLSFTSQNMGAKQYHRIDKILLQCLGVVTAVGLVLGVGAFLCGHTLLGIYSSSEDVITHGISRLSVVSASYFLCGIMDVMVGSLRGMGYSIMPMLVSLTGACLFRVIWIFTIFQMEHTLFSLYISYPISWILTFSAHVICYLVVRRKALLKAA
ncbi:MULTISPECIES: MATE family efflux transporter [Bacillota]|jgi:putative MATE family efflux protein|nr:MULTISPECIES: MATE family efflux transporter [Erysipelotrichaceae]MCH4283942.1 MATE family efflux transporter [Amedibacillus hominis]RGB56823.1 MATE family efflux transporter [Absiella sp. AM22-9]RGB60737.1 MATE family efflux transporter [Absiella sp. AM10-20]RGB69250.1 MATE family efflux transporter [Absiella sp. AM09-45]RGB79232.1 MATE family efflux transporter [Absiella sp. AM09-50]